jgi:hypothetical protein
MNHVTWSRKIKKRDKMCQTCGTSCRLVAHHIKSWVQYPEFRYDLTNGKTLCEQCHKDIKIKQNPAQKQSNQDYSQFEPTGEKYHYWNVLNSQERRGKKYFILCKCNCGTIKFVEKCGLKKGKSKSCGCFKKEILIQNFSGKNNPQYTHGQSLRKSWTKEYRCWVDIKTRCYNDNRRGYENYGGRGIKMCETWLNDFEHFFADMGKAPSPKHELDRIDVNGNYEKNNCRWITHSQNCLNTTKNKFITLNNKTQTYVEWERELQLTRGTISRRVKKGYSIERCLSPVKESKNEG